MNAIEFLEKEHHQVRELLTAISEGSYAQKTREQIFANLCQELLRHETMEHQLWYPRFKKDGRLTDKVQHLLYEEKGAEKAIKQFDTIADEDTWHVQFSKFKKAVEQHTQEEEQFLFPQIKKLVSEKELNQIGKEFSEFKRKYVS